MDLQTSERSFGYLNADCMIHVLSYVPQSQLFALSVLCSAMKDLIQSTALLWQHFDCTNIVSLQKSGMFDEISQHVQSLTLKRGKLYKGTQTNTFEALLAAFLKQFTKLTCLTVNSEHGKRIHFKSFHRLNLTSLHMEDTSHLSTKPFVACLKTLKSLNQVSFTTLKDSRQNFNLLKPELIRIGSVKIDVSGGDYTSGLLASDLEGIRHVVYLYSSRSYEYGNPAIDVYSEYLDKIGAISALDNVVSEYVHGVYGASESEYEESYTSADYMRDSRRGFSHTPESCMNWADARGINGLLTLFLIILVRFM